MKVTLKWANGDTVDLYDVHEVVKTWVGDEYLVIAKRRGEAEEHYTGKELGIKRAEEISGQTQSPNASNDEAGETGG